MSEEDPAALRLRDPPGFRFYPTDALVLAVGVAGGPLLWPSLGPPAALVPLVVGHFFLFCNVFRVRTRLELAWSAVLVANALAGLLAGTWSWPRVLGIQLPTTAVVLLAELWSREYKGVLHARVNPGLRWRPR